MKKQMTRTICLILALMLSCVTATAVAENLMNDSSKPVKAFSLPDSELGEAISEGEWRYALRRDNGLAEIVRYEGTEQDINVPVQMKDGTDVVGLASGALTDVSGTVKLNGNILHIAGDAFGSKRPVIRALNGTYAQAWAEANGFTAVVPTDYELMPGVIDFSDAPKGHIRRAGEDYIRFARLEGSRLSVGSVFWYQDERGINGIYRVTSLSEADGWTIAGVTAAELKTTVKNASISGEYTFTEADFTPAEGVRDAKKPADSKAPASVEGDEKNISKILDFKNSLGFKADDHSFSYDGTITVTAKVSTKYNLEIIEGEIVEFEETETKKIELEIDFGTFTYKYEKDKLEKFLEEKEEEEEEGNWPFFEEIDVGTLKLPSPGLFTIGIDLKAGIKADITGKFITTYSTVSTRHYEDGEWTVKKDHGHVTRDSWKADIAFALSGKLYVKLTCTIALVHVIKAFEASVELALKAKVEWKISSDPNAAPCITAEIGPEITFEAYAGAYVEVNRKDKSGDFDKITLGAKAKIWELTLDAEDLFGAKTKLHLYFGPDSKAAQGIHLEEYCPFSDRVTVTFDSRTSQLVEEAKVFKGEAIRWSENYRLADDEQAGHFKGWASGEDAVEPNWIFEQVTEQYEPVGPEGEPMPVEEPMTLYAIWENNAEVRFDTQGGSEIESQYVPVGGYAVMPDDPVKPGDTFQGWYSLEVVDDRDQDHIWDFDSDTVPAEGVTLYAQWEEGESYTGGTTEIMYIGDIDEINSDRYEWTIHPQNYLEYDKIYEPGSHTEILGINITGIKNNPTDLIIPEEISVLEGRFPVLSINSGTFRGCDSLRSIKFEMKNGVDTAQMFMDLPNLEYVDLSSTIMSEVQYAAFSNCPKLIAVKLPKGINTIGGLAFADCSSLTKLRIPKGVHALDEGAFLNCSGVTEVLIGDKEGEVRVSTLYSIHSSAFEGMTALQRLLLPEGILTIDSFAFKGCTSLKYARLPKSAANLGYCLFAGDTALEELYLGNMGSASESSSRQVGTTRHQYCSANIFGNGSSEPEQFYSLPALRKITIGNGAKNVCTDALCYRYYSSDIYGANYRSVFAGNGCLDIVLEEGITQLNYHAFAACSAIRTIQLPQSLETIGQEAFRDCSSIASITLGAGMKTLEIGTFYNCTGLVSFGFNSGLEIIKGEAFCGCSGLTELIVNEGVRSIGDYAFRYCSGLKKLVLPTTVTEYGLALFDGDSALETLVIGNAGKTTNNYTGSNPGLNTIFGSAYSYNPDDVSMPNMKTIVIGNGSSKINGYALAYQYGEPREDAPYLYVSRFISPFATGSGSITLIIEEGVEEIGANAFSGLTSIGKVVLPGSLRRIGESAFADCAGIRSLEMPIGLTDIGNGAFDGCSGLTEISFNPGLEKIGGAAFRNCTSLKRAILPEGVTFVGIQAFANCTSLEHVYLPRSAVTLGQGILHGDAALRTLYIGNAAMISDAEDEGNYYPGSIFQSRIYDEEWGKYVNLETVTIGSGSTVIPSNAFTARVQNPRFSYSYQMDAYPFDTGTGKAKLIIEDGVREIGNNAFMRASCFGEIQIPDTVETIGGNAFAYCTGIRTFRLPESLNKLSAGVFDSCSRLAEVSFNQRLEIIEQQAFMNCTSLKRAVLPEGVTEVHERVFRNCTALEYVYLPRSAAVLGEGLLHGDAALRTLYIGNAAMVTNAKDDEIYRSSSIFQDRDLAWGRFANLETVTIGAGSAVIPAEAFLTKVQNPSVSYTSWIGAYPFQTENGTARLVIEEGIREIGHSAFYKAGAFGEVVLPESLTTIGYSAFSECTGLKRMRMGGSVTSIGEGAFDRCNNLTVYLPSTAAYAIQYLNENNIAISIEGMQPFRLNLNANGGTFGNGETTAVRDVSWLAALTDLPEPDNGTKVFSGWFRDEEATRYFDTETEIMPAEDLTLYAGWDVNLHQLTLILNGGSLEGDIVRLIPAGMPFLSTLSPIKDGYVFTGWYTDGKLQSRWNDRMPQRDLVLYAGWSTYGTHGKYTFTENEATLTRYECGADEQTVYLPETVDGKPLTGIAAGAFDRQPVITLGLPASLTHIEAGALDGMSKLRTIFTAAGNSVFAANNGVLYSADGSTLVRWPADRGARFEVPLGVTAIADYAFDSALIRGIILPEGLTTIGSGAFRNSRLETLELPDTLSAIGPGAFRGCGELTLVTSGNGLRTIGEYAFANGNLNAMYYGPLTGSMAEYCEENGLQYNIYLVTTVTDEEEKVYTAQAGTIPVIPVPVWENENTVFDNWYTDEEMQTVWPEGSLMPQHGLRLYTEGRTQFELEMTDDGEGYCLTGYLLNKAKVAVPAEIDGTPVVAIAANCFGPAVTEITIPSTVTEIAENAFGGQNVTIIAPQGSAAYAYAAAHGMTAMTVRKTVYFRTNGGFDLEEIQADFGSRITLPEPVRPGWQFEGWYTDRKLESPAVTDDEDRYEMGMKDVTLYASWSVTDADVACIRFELNEAGTGLIVTGLEQDDAQTVEIPATAAEYPVTAVGPRALAWQRTITSVTLPDSVITIGSEAFTGCSLLSEIDLGGATVLGQDALKDCEALQELNLPEGLVRIESGALANTSVTEITLPSGFRYLSDSALNGCTGLTAINVEDGSAYYRSEDGVLYDTEEYTLVKYPAGKAGTDYTVTAGTVAIGAHAFENAAALKRVSLPDSVMSLGTGAFMGCSGLREIPELHSSYLTRIPEDCFRGCGKLKEVIIPDQITRIDVCAFYHCDNLLTIHIPDSVTVIGENAFVNSNAMIFGSVGSEAERFAAANRIAFTAEGAVAQTGMALSAGELTLEVDERAYLTAEALPEGAAGSAVRWSSSEEKIARVNTEGEVTAVARGRTVITARMAGGFSAECIVTVTGEEQISGLIMDGIPDQLWVGETIQASVGFIPVTMESAVTWSVSDDSVIAVSPEGRITALKAGITQVRATADNGVYEETTVIVVNDTRRIRIAASAQQAAIGQTIQLTAEYEDGTIMWTAEPESVATINGNGLLTMTGHGFVTVCAAYIDHTDRRTVLILECPGNNTLILPESLAAIEEWAFSGMQADAAILPETVQRVNAYAFADCPNLYKVVIPGAETEISEHAFDNSNVTIVCQEGSKALRFAENHGIPYIVIQRTE